MPLQPLPRSFKRKYKKLHTRFTLIQSSTASLEDDVNAVTATALKLIAENDMLLDLLIDLSSDKQPISVESQLSRYAKDDESTLDGNTNGDVLDDEYYTMDKPEHFKSLPWDLDLQSISGSHLEDIAKATALITSAQVPPAAETPTANPTSRKAAPRGPGSKKRERAVDGDEDFNNTATKKKKRKSMLVHNNSWTE